MSMETQELDTLENAVATFDDALACYDTESAQDIINALSSRGYDVQDMQFQLEHVADERRILEETGELVCGYDRV